MNCYWQVINHIENWSLENKAGIIPSYNRISTTVWLHHLDLKRLKKRLFGNNPMMLRVVFNKPWKQPLKKTAVVWPLIVCLINHLCKTKNTCWTLMEKKELISNVLLWTPAYQWRPTGKNLHSSTLLGHGVPSRWLFKWWPIKRVRVKGICAVTITWWR